MSCETASLIYISLKASGAENMKSNEKEVTKIVS